MLIEWDMHGAELGTDYRQFNVYKERMALISEYVRIYVYVLESVK